jgi:dUTP pyrophosphatase
VEIEVRILDGRLSIWGFPYYGSESSAGMDLFACLDSELELPPQAAPALVPTGIAIHISDPEWCGVIVPRSGLGHHQGLILGNSIGIIDADYTGECYVSAWNRRKTNNSQDARESIITIRPGDRIAQLLILRVTRPSWRVVNEFRDPNERGTRGFGSTDRSP